MTAQTEGLPRLPVPVDTISNISLYLDLLETGPVCLYEELIALARD
jgi:hypothetical protein